MHPATTIGLHLANLTRTYSRMSSYASGHAGPAIRQAISALNNWRDYGRPGELETLAAASALCDAAENIRARQATTFRRLIDHPWPTCLDTVASLFRAAHGLAPGILDEGQKGIAGIEPAPCVEG